MKKKVDRLNKTEIINEDKVKKSEFFTFDEIKKARMAVRLSIALLGVVLLSVIIFFIFFKQTQDEVLERIKERDIIVLTNAGAISGKTSPVYDLIVKQFGQTAFISTLIYDPRDIMPQLNFMKIYSDPEIFKNYRQMIQNSKARQAITQKMFYARIDSKKGIELTKIIPNKKYGVVIYGERQVLTNYKDTNERYSFKLEMVIEKDNQTNIENMYGLKITQYRFTKTSSGGK